MTNREFRALMRAQQAEIDRRLDNPEDCELTCREVDDWHILGILRPTPGGRMRKTFVVSGRDEEGHVEHEWAEDFATVSQLYYITMYGMWEHPTYGAVSPAMSEFFAFCHPETPAEVHWARWVRQPKEDDAGAFSFDPEVAEILVEAAIATQVTDATLADQMRRAVAGEPLGECDPDQLELF